MRRTLGLALLASVAASATAFAVYQSSGSALLATFGKSLNDAKAVRATYTIRTMGTAAGSVTEEFSVALKKPNLARIESQGQIIVMDGKQVTTFSKASNTYFKRPQAEGELRALLADGDLSIMLGFSDPNAYQAPASRALGQKQLNGAPTNVVEAQYAHATTTYYLDPSDNVARTCTTDFKTPGAPTATVLIRTTAFEMNPNLADSVFTFAPPDGSRELSLDEINAGKWYTDLAEACKVAEASHRRVFIDFMATWCGPCKMLDEECLQTETFKSFSKKFVFCRIDIDQQPEVGTKYGASAIPLQVITDSSGGVIDKTVGYGGSGPFFAFLRKNAG